MTALVQTTPRRIRLRREKGWRLAEATNNPNGLVIVDRRSQWGNPFVVHKHTLQQCGPEPLLIDCPLDEHQIAVDNAAEAVRRLRHTLQFPLISDPWYPSLDAIRDELAGKDLVCWCPLDGPCHGDLLLELANPGWEAPA